MITHLLNCDSCSLVQRPSMFSSLENKPLAFCCSVGRIGTWPDEVKKGLIAPYLDFQLSPFKLHFLVSLPEMPCATNGMQVMLPLGFPHHLPCLVTEWALYFPASNILLLLVLMYSLIFMGLCLLKKAV